MITFGSDVGDLILQRTLSESTLGLNNSINRMTTGYKVNHAKDNAAGYSIITDLSTQISSMLQVQQNTDDGIALLLTAEGGLEEIQKLLERLRALATQASNGTYDATTRASMQAEVDEILEQINQIKDTVQYNGMNLYQTSDENMSLVTRIAGAAKLPGAAKPSAASSPQLVPQNAEGEPLRSFNSLKTVTSFTASAASDKIEGAEEFGASETKTITIDGVKYTIRNLESTAKTISYAKDTQTGELTFYGNVFEIKCQADASHNLIIEGNRNRVYGGNLDDTISVTNNKNKQNYIYGGAGNDTLVSAAQSVMLYGGGGNDTFHVRTTLINAYGGAGDDIFNLYADAFNQTMYGGAGNDTFNINGSRHKCLGEDGEDTFNIKSGMNDVVVDGGSGTNSVTDNGINTIKINVPGANGYAVDFAANEQKEVTINSIKYTIKNNKSSAQTLYYSVNNGLIEFKSADFTIKGDKNSAHKVKLSANGINFYGGNYSDNIIMNANDIHVFAGSGDDVIKSNGINSVIYGEDGNDTITNVQNTSYVDGGNGDDSIEVASKTIGSIIYGGSGNNTITDKGINTMKSGFGNSDNSSALMVGAGATTSLVINGITYSIKNTYYKEAALLYNYNPVTDEITLGGSRFEIRGQADKVHNVKVGGYNTKFFGGNFNDTLKVFSRDVYLYGGEGDDVLSSDYDYSKLYGQGGNDTIIINGRQNYCWGGDGDDNITVNDLSIQVIKGESGNDTYNINAACTVEDSGGNNIFYLNKTNATVTGSMGDDTFYVSGSTNNVLGSGGNDYFVVTGSNNIIDGGSGDDLYTDTGSGNTIQNMNYDPNNGTLNFTYLGEVKTFEINGAKYTITNDKNGNNTLTYSYNPNAGTIKLDGSALLIDGVMDVENKLDIYGSNNTINGGNKSDTITVQSGSNNIINAGAGNDTLTMNSENNSLLGESGDDKIILNASTNKLVDSGIGNDSININSNNNVNIQNSSGDDNIIVSGENNSINAGEGNNSITINKKGNTVSAGNGNNKFVVDSDNNIITSGTGKNNIGISGDNNNLSANNSTGTVSIYGDSNNVSISSGKNNVVIKGGSNHYIGGDEVDTVKISGNDNYAEGGGANDRFVITSGNNNSIDGNEGSRNTLTDNGINTTFKNIYIPTSYPFTLKLKVDIGSGDDKYITAELDFTTDDLFVDLSTAESSLTSLEIIDEYIRKVQSQLTHIGTVVNRLESVAEAQTIKLENLVSFRSTMRDADIAEESSNYIRYQILQQASSTLLASSRNLKAGNILGLLSNINQ